MQRKNNHDEFLRAYAKLIGQTGKSPDELMAAADRNFYALCRRAEVDEILADCANYDAPIPGDVSDAEIAAALARYKNNSTFRLSGRGGGDAGPRHGASYIQASRDRVLKMAGLEKLRRDSSALSLGAALGQIAKSK